MIPYHGLPITPATAAARILSSRHAFISHATPLQLDIAQELCRSFALDNGAFSAWTDNRTVNWEEYYRWVADWMHHPAYDFSVIPDVIDGSEQDNDDLIRQWPHGRYGAPVWHLHESINRLERLAEEWDRICLGSSAEFSRPGTPIWWARIEEIMPHLCDPSGFPKVKIHGLRMMNPKLRRIPFSSVDSTAVGRNIGIDVKWKGTYTPPTKEWRAVILAERLEQAPCATRWVSAKTEEESV